MASISLRAYCLAPNMVSANTRSGIFLHDDPPIRSGVSLFLSLMEQVVVELLRTIFKWFIEDEATPTSFIMAFVLRALSHYGGVSLLRGHLGIDKAT